MTEPESENNGKCYIIFTFKSAIRETKQKEFNMDLPWTALQRKSVQILQYVYVHTQNKTFFLHTLQIKIKK